MGEPKLNTSRRCSICGGSREYRGEAGQGWRFAICIDCDLSTGPPPCPWPMRRPFEDRNRPWPSG